MFRYYNILSTKILYRFSGFPQSYSKLIFFSPSYHYDWGMRGLESFVDDRLIQGFYTFTKNDAKTALALKETAFLAAAARLKRKGRLVSPKRGFYLVLRPEDRALGAPPPERWIAALMAYLDADYRISLLRAAAFHGSSHQAVMVFQVIAPKQLKPIAVGRQRIQFVYQEPRVFAKANRPEWLDRLKNDTGFAKVAGIELTLLDSARYFHKAAGINGVAQIVHDLGSKADVHKLADAAKQYENAAVRRLGYLLERFHHTRQAAALFPFAQRTKSIKPLDPAVRSFTTLARAPINDPIGEKWKLKINESVEIDT
jgi:predicted transcriptional regulator of viral defense system